MVASHLSPTGWLRAPFRYGTAILTYFRYYWGRHGAARGAVDKGHKALCPLSHHRGPPEALIILGRRPPRARGQNFGSIRVHAVDLCIL